MILKYKKKNLINGAIFISVLFTIIIYARQDGIVGATLKNGSGCTCHGDNFTLSVLVTISGPDTLAVGQTANYMVTIQGGPLAAGGTNIAASNGNLLPIAGDLRKESDELTHVLPKSPSAGKVTFEFTYTAPSVTGAQILFANGNSVNLNGGENGDQWNFAANKNITVIQPTSVDDNILANTFELKQNYPNPFNPSTKISWQSPVSSLQTLKVYDVIGNEVSVLIDEWKEAGNHSVNFDAAGLPSGVYLYKLTAGNYIETKKMMLVR